MSSRVESEWDDESRELVVAAARLRALTGPNGEYLPEATSKEADPNSYSGWRPVARGPFTNEFEKARLDAMDQFKQEAGEKANLNGMYWTVERVDY